MFRERRHAQAMERDHVAQTPDDIDLSRLEGYLLVGFPQCRGEQIPVFRLPLAAREGDLAGVLGQMRGALGEQQRWLGARDDGEKHGRLRVGAVQPTRAMCLQAFTDFL